MDKGEFIGRYPRLWHLAHGDAWPGIRRHGLLTTAQVLDLFGVDPPGISSRRRTTPVPLTHPEHGNAVIRDQKPLNLTKLASALTDGMTVEQWLTMLDGLVFFFPTEKAMGSMLNVYGVDPVVVLTVDTRSLVKDYEPWIRLAAINTGSVLYKPAPRGAETFERISRFDHRTRAVKEVAVKNGLPDLETYLVRAERRYPDGSREALWAAPASGSSSVS